MAAALTDPAHSNVKLRGDLAIVAVVAAVSTLPLWLARFPIGQDLPAHIETAAQIRALWAGDTDVAAWYRLHAQPWPNALPVVLLAPLLAAGNGVLAAKVLLGIGVVAWPLSIALLLQRLQRPVLLAVLVWPSSFDLSFSYGFLHFVMGKPVWALCLVAAFDVASRASTARLIRLALLFVVLFTTHIMLFATALPLCLGVIALCGADGPTRIKGSAAAALGATPALWWWVHQPPSSGGTAAFLPLTTGLARAWTNLGDLHDGAVDALPWLLVLLAFIVAMGSATRSAVRRQTTAMVVVVGALVAFAWLGPVRLPQVSVVAERFWSLGAALLVAVPPVVLSKRGRIVIVIAAVLGLCSHVVDLTQRWRAFSRDEMGDFDALLTAVPPHSRVATYYVTPLSSWGRHNALWHWGKLVALNGSSSDDSFAWRDTCVVGLAAGQTPPRHPALVDPELEAWDYLLVRGASSAVDRQLAALHLQRVTTTGTWRLFRVVKANPSTPQPPDHRH